MASAGGSIGRGSGQCNESKPTAQKPCCKREVEGSSDNFEGILSQALRPSTSLREVKQCSF